MSQATTVARSLFDSGHPDDALRVLVERLGTARLATADRELLDLLYEPSMGTEIPRVVLARHGEDMSHLERATWQARLFDATADPAERREAALDLLATATLAGEDGWALVQEPLRRERLDHAFREPDDRVELLAQEALAPEATGLPATVAGRAFILGRDLVRAHDLASAREIEQLLHGLGESALAYQVERERKAAGPAARPLRAPRPLLQGPPLEVLVAGGTSLLRRNIADEFARLGIGSVRPFPSAWEGNRHARHARDLMAGADLAVIVRRQIAHSTSDQVATTARALDVPVVRADTPTVGSVRRAVLAFRDRERI